MLRRSAGLLLILLALGLCWRGRWLDSQVEVRMRGWLRLGHYGGPLVVELWLPRPRIFVDGRGRFFHREEDGTLVALSEVQNHCRVHWRRGELLITLKLRCSPSPDVCTVAVHQNGFVTRYARLVRLSGTWGNLSAELPSLGRPLRRLESKEELFNLVRKAQGK